MSLKPVPAVTVVQSLKGDWKKEITRIKDPRFTEDSHQLAYLNAGDSLCLLTLGDSSVYYIPAVGSFRLFMGDGGEWLVYQIKDTSRRLVLKNLSSGRTLSFQAIDNYILGNGGEIAILNVAGGARQNGTRRLLWVDLRSGSIKEIWSSDNQGIKIENMILDNRDRQLAFLVEAPQDSGFKINVWYCKDGMSVAERLVEDGTWGTLGALRLEELVRFNRNGSRLFVKLQDDKRSVKKNSALASVDVWSYNDTVLQPHQLDQVAHEGEPDYLAVIGIRDGHMLRLQQKGERELGITGLSSDDYRVMDDCRGNYEERYWSAGAQPSSTLVSTVTGARKHISLDIQEFSPNGAFLIGTDRDWNLYGYEISTGQICDISRSIPVPYFAGYVDSYRDQTRGIQFAAWVGADSCSLLVYDRYDIWQVDPSGKRPPINVTHGFGRKNKTELRLSNYCFHEDKGKWVDGASGILLTAFNKVTKRSGFYSLNLGSSSMPAYLASGPYDYKPIFGAPSVTKAKDADVYLITRASVTEAPNYYWTADFKTMTALSTVHPEKRYKWLTTTLVSFKSVNGVASQGILYKPEDFDPKKKYPVIITYYRERSDELNFFPSIFSGYNMSIPWLTSHGYLVFIPDIYYETGKVGRSALNFILGAAAYLEKFPWVDGTHMGLCGHSFAGFETNYVVTHSRRFAAAVASSGMSDVVFDYNGKLWGGVSWGSSGQGYYENRGGVMHATLWEHPEFYLENSPILYADRIKTPLLQVANIGDGNVPFEHGLEMYQALRRLGKPGWMLQYDHGGHGLNGGQLLDFIIRSQQFFDYYLKGAPAPKWMVEGVPADLKQIDSGLSLEARGVTPGPGLLIPEEQKKADGLQHRKPITVSISRPYNSE